MAKVAKPKHLPKMQKTSRYRYRDKKGEVKLRGIGEKSWQKILQGIASGMTLAKAIKAQAISKPAFDAWMITNVAAPKQLQEARLSGMRTRWSIELIDEILDKISLGNTVKHSMEMLGYEPRDYASFLKLVRHDPKLREWYDHAREIQAESWLDDVIDIADDKHSDTFIDSKGNERTNHEVINRSRLKVDTRKWAMGVVNRRRFGDVKHVDHSGDITINHAAVLANARKRLEKTREPVIIDNDTQQVSD